MEYIHFFSNSFQIQPLLYSPNFMSSKKKKILTSICAARKEEKLNTDSFAFVDRDQTNTKLQILLAWLIAGTYPSSCCS